MMAIDMIALEKSLKIHHTSAIHSVCLEEISTLKIFFAENV